MSNTNFNQSSSNEENVYFTWKDRFWNYFSIICLWFVNYYSKKTFQIFKNTYFILKSAKLVLWNFLDIKKIVPKYFWEFSSISLAKTLILKKISQENFSIFSVHFLTNTKNQKGAKRAVVKMLLEESH
jgi:hypothetical protein